MALQNISHLLMKKEMMKSKIKAHQYILDMIHQQKLLDPPIDNMTGKPFLVTVDGDSLEVMSEYKRKHDEAAYYKMKLLFIGRVIL